ncbi:MAG: rhomboid family intramembrane serine protease [Candidatus Rokuibacteriota bacterium]|nr:MAG: rhomboid family intramembrane serine protease [Candidatus Rokubacteria bacterium]
MFRKTTGAILCPSCGRLTNADAPVCLVCGRRNPGMWGFGGPLARLFRSWNFANAVTAACIGLYVVSLVFDPRGALAPRGPFEIFSPTGRALEALGMTGSVAWLEGRWWTLLTAIYLHGGVLHILFNVLWIRQLGPEVEKLYGPARLVVIFTVSGAAGFVVSNSIGVPFTIGASGAIFGLLGAIVAFGRKRGGVFGQMVLRQYGQWALVLFVLGFFMPGVNNWAHAGGFAGGFASGLLLSLAEHRTETVLDKLLAAAALALTVAGFFLALWTAFTG